MRKKNSWKNHLMRSSEREERLAYESVKAVEAPQEATKTTEFSQVISIQDINFLEAQDARERWALMYQQA
jgi:hypothetical protein